MKSYILRAFIFFSGIAISTQQANCGAFEVENGSVDYSTDPSGIIALVTCDTGHLADKGIVLTCLEALGKWNLPIPKCQVWYCDITELERQNRVRILDSALEFKSNNGKHRRIKMGGWITMVCENPLEKPEGYATVSCALPQRWNLPALYCKSYCKKFNVEHGNVDVTDAEGLLAKTSCDRGYKIKGPPVLTCVREIRSWNVPPPKCVPDMNYCAIDDRLEEENGIKIISAPRKFTSHDGIEGVKLSGVVRLACKPGYIKQAGYPSIVCIATNRFDLPILRCKAPKPTDPPKVTEKPKNKNGGGGGKNRGGNKRNRGNKNKNG